jgi:hypothetical protein
VTLREIPWGARLGLRRQVPDAHSGRALTINSLAFRNEKMGNDAKTAKENSNPLITNGMAPNSFFIL